MGSGIGLLFHEDRFAACFGSSTPDGSIATFDPERNKLTRYGFDSRGHREALEEPGLRPAGGPRKHHVVWNCGLGLLKFEPLSIGVSSATEPPC